MTTQPEQSPVDPSKEGQKPAPDRTAEQAVRQETEKMMEQMQNSYITVEDALAGADADERTRSLLQRGIITAIAREKYNGVVFGKDIKEQLPPDETPLPDVVMEEFRDGTKHPAAAATLARRFEQQGRTAFEPFMKAKLSVFDVDSGVESAALSISGLEPGQERVHAMEVALGRDWRNRVRQDLLARSSYETPAQQQSKDVQESTKKRSRIRAALDRLFGTKG